MVKRLVNLCIHWETDVGAGSQFDKIWKISPRQMNVKRFNLLGWNIDRIETGGPGDCALEVYVGKNDDGKGPFLDAWQFGERFLGGGGLIYNGSQLIPHPLQLIYPKPIPFDIDDVLVLFTTWINKSSETRRFELHMTFLLEVED